MSNTIEILLDEPEFIVMNNCLYTMTPKEFGKI